VSANPRGNLLLSTYHFHPYSNQIHVPVKAFSSLGIQNTARLPSNTLFRYEMSVRNQPASNDVHDMRPWAPLECSLQSNNTGTLPLLATRHSKPLLFCSCYKRIQTFSSHSLSKIRINRHLSMIPNYHEIVLCQT